MKKTKSEEEMEVPNFFGRKKKNEEENAGCLYSTALNFLNSLKQKAGSPSNAVKKFNKYNDRAMEILNGTVKTGKSDPVLLTKSEYFNKTIVLLIKNSHQLPFEMKKDVVTLIHDALKVGREEGKEEFPINHTAEYLSKQINDLTNYLFTNFDKEDMFFFIGNTLRCFLKNDVLLKKVLNMEFFIKLSEFVESKIFEISSEAFETFHTIFSQKRDKDRKVVSEFIKANYEKFLEVFMKAINNENYLSTRDALRTLHEILEDPFNNEIEIKFISKKENLMMVMNNLTNENKGIQFEAFMLLEHFMKDLSRITSEDVLRIIKKNKISLLKFVREFKDEEEADYKVNREMLLHQLEELPD